MSDYGFYLERARTAAAMLSSMEATAARNPNDLSLRLNVASAQRLMAGAERSLADITRRESVDVCRYRLVPLIAEEFAVRGVARSLESFQEMFSQVHDAIIRGGRDRAGVPPERRQETTLEFGYSFSGSLGVVLVMPGQLSLFEGKFDRTLDAINQVFEIEDNDGLRDAAHKLGRAAIQKVFEWSQANSREGFEVDLKWTTPATLEKGRYIDHQQFARTAQIISQTTESESLPLRVIGTLVGINVKTKSFHFVEPDGESFRGQLDDDFPADREWTVNQEYIALMSVETTVRFATGQETKRYKLQSLK